MTEQLKSWEEPLDKAEHLLKLADLASAMGDFRMAARFYEDSIYLLARYGQEEVKSGPCLLCANERQ